MKLVLSLMALVFSSAAMAGYVYCKAADFRALNAALKSRKLEKTPETQALVPEVKGILMQESQIGVKCEKLVDLVPRFTIPGQVMNTYRVSDSSRAYEIIVSTNPVERGDRLTIQKIR